IHLELPLAVELALDVRIEDADAPPTLFLGRIERDVRAGEELVRLARMLRRERQPDAGPGRHLPFTDQHRFCKLCHESRGRRMRPRDRVRTFHEDGELIPTEPYREIGRVDDVPDPP